MSLDVIFLANTASASLYDMTLQAIKSVKREAPDAHVVVVETNACHTFGVYPCLTIEPRKPFNYNAFMNIGIKAGKADFVLMCNNDIEFLPGSVKTLLEGMEANELESASPWEPSWHASRFPVGPDVFFGHTIEREVCGWCIAARRTMLDRLQPLDEQFEFWAQDLDYAKTLEVNGVRHGLIRSAQVRHRFSMSHDLLGARREEMTHEQNRRFQRKWAAPKPRVFDCFTFFNEFRLLNFRLAELRGVVDQTILIEATQTFSGKPKNALFFENRRGFSSFSIHAVLLDGLDGKNAWEREACQRNAIMRGLEEQGAKDHDWVFVSDADEIPHPGVIERAAHGLGFTLGQALYYYNLECQATEPWQKAKLLRFSELKRVGSVEAARMTNQWPVLPNAGWHFSYFGDEAFIREKVAAFSHQELNTNQWMNSKNIQKALAEGIDLFGRNVAFRRVPADRANATLPTNYRMLL